MTLLSDFFLLETLTPENASSLNRLMISNGKRFQEYLPKTLAQNLSETDSKIYIKKKNQAIKNATGYTFAIKDIETKEVVGLIILKNLDLVKKQGEFAYCLGAKQTGKGWMTQSIMASSQFAFNTLGLTTLQIITHKANIESVNVAKRCGFKWTKTLKNEFTPPGKNPVDMELYELHNEN